MVVVSNWCDFNAYHFSPFQTTIMTTSTPIKVSTTYHTPRNVSISLVRTDYSSIRAEPAQPVESIPPSSVVSTLIPSQAERLLLQEDVFSQNAKEDFDTVISKTVMATPRLF